MRAYTEGEKHVRCRSVSRVVDGRRVTAFTYTDEAQASAAHERMRVALAGQLTGRFTLSTLEEARPGVWSYCVTRPIA
jgi:hypothetical protein